MKDPWDALSDPTRREILKLLRDGPLHAGGISQNFPFTKSTISRHLEVLEDSGLILSEKRKQYIYYQLRREAIQPLREYLSFLENHLSEPESSSPVEKSEKRPVPKGSKPPEPAGQEDAEPKVPSEKKVSPKPSHTPSRRGKVPSYLD